MMLYERVYRFASLKDRLGNGLVKRLPAGTDIGAFRRGKVDLFATSLVAATIQVCAGGVYKRMMNRNYPLKP